MLEQRIGFIGAGQMAEALMKGILESGLSAPEKILASDVVKERLESLQQSLGIRTTQDNAEVAAGSDILVLAVKPDVVATALESIRDSVTGDHLVISIAAGVTLEKIEGGLGSEARVIRVMPNTPCLVRETAAGFALGKNARPEDGQTAENILSSVGRAFCLDEKHLDAVTGLSGSGPAYVYVLIEALADGGVRCGLPRQVAQALAAQTVLGAARMVLETGLHPGELKDRVASPGGTTIAGLHELEKGKFRAALMNAVEAATRRSAELG